MRVVVAVVVTAALLLAEFAQAMDFHSLKQFQAKNNVSCVLVFGDSSVDPGNNNVFPLAPKANFLPYGRDFLSNGRPTGRFSNGRLATDFIVEALGYTKIIRAFLDPTVKKEDLLHGISFASAGSGYDDLTANFSNALPISKQLEYFVHYKVHLKQLVGEAEAEKTIRNAIFVISMGTNDFLQNYYFDSTRSKQFTVEQYQKFLISCMSNAIKTLHHLGAQRLAIVGVPPFGCMPLVKTLRDESKCVDEYNQVALAFNYKIKRTLATLKTSLGMQTSYIDIYNVIESAMKSPMKYGLKETSKGCCGSGTIEYGDLCRGMSTCTDPKEYLFWDAVHPTEKMYEIVAVVALRSISGTMLQK